MRFKSIVIILISCFLASCNASNNGSSSSQNDDFLHDYLEKLGWQCFRNRYKRSLWLDPIV